MNRFRNKSINNLGQVVGYSETTEGKTHAFIWNSITGMTDLGTLGGSSSQATSINEKGEVVGFSDTSNGQSHAFIWRSNTGMSDLGTLGGPSSRANDINDNSEVVGFSDTNDGQSQAFLWNQNNGVFRLGTLGGQSSEARIIDNKAKVMGFSYSINQYHVFAWSSNSGMTDLGDLGNQTPTVINQSGQVIVHDSWPPHAPYWFLWHSGSENEIPTVSYADSVQGLNTLGQFIYGNILYNPLDVSFYFDISLATPNGTLNWIGGSNGNWDDSANWEIGFVPNKFLDTVIASQTGNTFVSGPSKDVNVNSLTIGGGNGNSSLLLNSGILKTNNGVNLLSGSTLSFDGNGKLTNDTKLTVDGGVLDIKNYNITLAGVQLKSGSITASTGTVTSINNYDFQSGTISANLDGSVGLNKTTSGKIILTGNNTYTGTTKVSEGILMLLGTLKGPLINEATIDGSGTGITLAGDVSGIGNYTGNITFAGKFSPSNGPNLVRMENVNLASTSTMVMELGGLNRGTQYDALNANNVKLGGLLDVQIINGYVPSPGDSFNLITANSIAGNFDQLVKCPEQKDITCRLKVNSQGLILEFLPKFRLFGNLNGKK